MPGETFSKDQVTALLAAWSNGDRQAIDALMRIVYQELHRLAHQHFAREQTAHTLQTTALVNEAYLRLVKQRAVHWQNRDHFFALAAQMMRRVLVDYARARLNAKRGGGARKIPLEDQMAVTGGREAYVIAVHEALERLAKHNVRWAEVIDCRYFAGFSVEQTAAALGVSDGTVKRDCTSALAWLTEALRGNPQQD